MKPRHLIEAKESVGAELALALERIAVLEARMDRTEAREDRQLTASCRQNDRIARLEEHAGIDAQPEIVGQTIRGFAAKVHRSPSAIRKLVAAGRIPSTRRGARVIIDAGAETLPPRKRRL